MDQVTAAGGLITIVHFMFESVLPPPEQEGPPVSQWRIACMPNMTEFHQTPYHPNYQRANDVRAVTCPACRKTQVFRQEQQRLDVALGGSARGA